MPTGLPSLEKECFFIAPIGSDDSDTRARSDGVLEFIVKRAATEVGLAAVRADQLAQPGQITIQVLDHVLGARAAVADLTGLNANVFYELAVRHTARLPVVLICDRAETLPFDIAQMRTVFFDHTDLRSADQCRGEIVAQLREAFEGAVDSPIATTLDVKALQGGNTVERNVAELVTTVEDLAKAHREIFMYLDGINREITDRRRRISHLPRDAVEYAWRGVREIDALAEDRGDSELKRLVRYVLDPLDFLMDRVEGHRNPSLFDSENRPRPQPRPKPIPPPAKKAGSEVKKAPATKKAAPRKPAR